LDLPEPYLRTDLRSGDIGALTRLHGLLYAREYGWDYTFEAYVAQGLAEFALNFQPDRDRLWLADVAGEIVGSVAIFGRSAEEAQLRWYLVHPDYRGRGLGGKLLRMAVSFARECGFRCLYLWTTSDLTAAARQYLAAGFHKTESKTHLIWGKMVTEEKYQLI